MASIFRKRRTFDVVLIGAGKLAWHLAPALEGAGHRIEQLYSRNIPKGERLAARLYETFVTNSLDFSASEAEIFLLAVSDDAIQQIAAEIVLPDGAILLHTSGGRPMDDLSVAAADGTGVLYPLQTFTVDKEPDFRLVPFLIEASSESVLKTIFQLASSLSHHVEKASSEQRAFFHIAAVFACNFTNHMMHIAESLLGEEGLDFEMLKPLMKETFQKALSLAPSVAQTGPAVRGDLMTMNRHIAMLQEEDPQLANLYMLLSEHISRFHQK
jgi:predicted short-subunit dehydrogenase-like oxidoreductase (DUF2520 family)